MAPDVHTYQLADPATLKLEEIRATGVAVARGLIGTPYYFGGSDKTGMDCNEVIEQAGRAVGVYPVGPRLCAADLWTALDFVDFDKRQPLDVVCYGASNLCHHVMLVTAADELVGAIHGKPPFEGESDDAYKARMAAANARVAATSADYWRSAVLGCVRFKVISAAMRLAVG